MSTAIATYSAYTIGEVEVHERFTFVSQYKYNPGDTIDLKRQKPEGSPAYGYGQITAVYGKNPLTGNTKYQAIRIR